MDGQYTCSPEDFGLAPIFLRKHKVTAHDFAFGLDAILNPHVQESGAASLRNYLGDIEEFRVVDDLTFVVRWKAEPVTNPDNGVHNKVKYTARSLTGSLSPLPRWVFQYFPDGTKIVTDDASPDTYRTNSVWAQNLTQHWARNTKPAAQA